MGAAAVSSDAHEDREHGRPLRQLLEPAAQLLALQDLDVGAHDHPVVVRMAPRGAAVVLRERVAEVGWTVKGSKEDPPREIRSLQKFERV